MAELVLREDNDGLTILTFNRPEALNALSPSLFVQLRNHIDDIAEKTGFTKKDVADTVDEFLDTVCRALLIPCSSRP